MRIHIYMLLLFALHNNNLLADSDTTAVKVKSSLITVDQATMNLQFFVTIKCDTEFDEDFFVTNHPKFEVKYLGVAGGVVSLKSFIMKDNQSGKFTIIGCKVEHLNTDFVNYLLASGDKSASISVEKDIILKLKTGKYGRIKKEEINSSISKITLTDEERKKYLSNPLAYYYYDQQFDFGVQPKDSNNKSYYFLTLKTTNSYGESKTNENLFWSIDMRLSTNFSDSLNYIKYYPLQLSWRSKDFSTGINIRLGHESNQTFEKKRVATDIGFSFMPGNLVKLIGPEPRLRPKPVIEAGLKGYYDYSNNQTAFASGMAFMNAHYYIPIFDKYSLILDGNTFYDLSKTNNPAGIVAGNYSIQFGIELPKTPFTALFKFVNGKTDINYKQGQTVGIGLLMGLIKN